MRSWRSYGKIEDCKQSRTKYPPNWCCTIIKVSVHTRGHVAATYPWDKNPQHFHVCANVVILFLLHVPATRPCYMSPQCVLNKFLSLQHVATTCPCNMTPSVCPPLHCCANFQFRAIFFLRLVSSVASPVGGWLE